MTTREDRRQLAQRRRAATSAPVREVVRLALAKNAAAVLIAHDHPSGVSEPSHADELITRRLKDALALVLTNHVALGLHLPPGAPETTAELESDSLHISGVTESGRVDLDVPLRLVPHEHLGNAGTISRGITKIGETHIWYLYMARTALPDDLLHGTVALPAITINGQRYESQMLRFERRHSPGLALGAP